MNKNNNALTKSVSFSLYMICFYNEQMRKWKGCVNNLTLYQDEFEELADIIYLATRRVEQNQRKYDYWLQVLIAELKSRS